MWICSCSFTFFLCCLWLINLYYNMDKLLLKKKKSHLYVVWKKVLCENTQLLLNGINRETCWHALISDPVNDFLLGCPLVLPWRMIYQGSKFVNTPNHSYVPFVLINIYIYIYAFSRCFYPKRLTLYSSYSFTFYHLLLSLGIEPMILALLAPCSTIWATGKLQYFYTNSCLCWDKRRMLEQT